MKRLAILLGLLFVVQTVSALPVSSCNQVRAYFENPPEDRYARIQDLKHAVEFLMDSARSDCEDFLKERTLFEYADELDKFSASFDKEDARRTWASDAAEAYSEYLTWFLGLSDTAQNRLIGILTKSESPELSNTRGRWIRLRVGNVLHSMGAALIRAGGHEKLLSEYERLSGVSIEIFAAEVVKDWYKWLRTLPDYRRTRTAAEIRSLMVRESDYSERWITFSRFLAAYIEVSPSVRSEWQAIKERIEKWLDS